MKTTRNEKGMAIIETLPMVIIFVLLIGYSFGMYGIIQSAVLNSIGARVYAFETFRNRTSLVYFRSTQGADARQYLKVGSRFHMTESEYPAPQRSFEFPATERPLAMGINAVTTNSNSDTTFHNVKLPQMAAKNRYTEGVAPVWIKVGYGMCVTAKCEPE